MDGRCCALRQHALRALRAIFVIFDFEGGKEERWLHAQEVLARNLVDLHVDLNAKREKYM
jgi:hypothetical protein